MQSEARAIRVALVDDHQLFRKGVLSLLQDMDDVQVVIEADSGEAFLELLPMHPIDVVLLDMAMTGIDGLTTMQRARNIQADLKVLFLTMHNEQQFVLNCMEMGANGFLQKDAHPDEVERGIRKVMASGHYFTQQVSKILLDGLEQWKTGERTQELHLNEREREVMRLICLERTTAEIAAELHLSPRTIEGYRERLMEKTKARNSIGLVVYAARAGWLEPWINKRV